MTERGTEARPARPVTWAHHDHDEGGHWHAYFRVSLELPLNVSFQFTGRGLLREIPLLGRCVNS